jgi:monofunctional biosynthetic peptidoglycan transglycosylase
MYRPRDLAADAKRLMRGGGRSGGRIATLIARVAVLLVAVPLGLIVAFRFAPPPITPLMVIRLLQGQPLRHQWVAYENIAPALPLALIASEDNLFCEETFGFDAAAARVQVDAWEEGERPRGASTITMQTAKNLLLWPGRDPVRKAIEAWLTPQIALLWPKRRVLEVYLNIVEFGPGIYGAEAAARWFFHKPAADLTPREAAQLVSVLPRPLVWVAAPPGPYVRLRAGVIERRIEQLGPRLGCAR